MAIVPLYARSRGDGGGVDWALVPFFLLVLLALRVVPAIVRRVLPFSEEARADWSRRRLLAKQFDSYQWRKLLWVGLGLAVSAVSTGQAGPVRTVLSLACLLAGGLGAVRWRRLSRSREAVAVLSRTRPVPVTRPA
jgi:hypothetical protein